MRKSILIICFLSIACFHETAAQRTDNYSKDSIIYYTIRPVPLKDRTNLEISVVYKAKSDTAILINLPQDYYGVSDLYKYVTIFEGKRGCVVKPAPKPSQRIVLPNKKKEVAINYTISYDPKELDGTAFAPNVSASHFHVAGCQWMLPVRSIFEKHTYNIKVVDAPKGWHFYSSISGNPKKTIVSDSYENLLSTAIGGGIQAYKKIIISSKPVYIFVAGKYNISYDSIFAATAKIVELQRSWFNDYDFPFYTITINPRSGIISGTGIPNLFVCFLKQDITMNELNVLLSHEMFHTWLPNKIYVKQKKGESDLKYEWLYEGLTDYFGRKILFDAGLLSTADFVYLINRDLINIADNPHKAETYTAILASNNKGTYGTDYKKLSYYKGALIALRWETQIRNAANGKQLKDFIREIYDSALTNNGDITELVLFNISKKYGIDAEKDLEQFIVNGFPIVPLPDALGDRFQLIDTLVSSFDPGFSLKETFRTRKIKDVVEGGVAYNAGLRNDMDFVDVRNSNRFGNGWSPDKPISVTVKINGENKIFEYFPHGKSMAVMLYSPVK